MIFSRSAAPKFIYVTPHFKAQEYLCPCGKCDIQKIGLKFALLMETLRVGIGRPVKFTDKGGAFRCREYNAQIGGVKDSQHTEGTGGDIYVVGMTGLHLARACLQVGFRAIGVAGNWCHVDDRGADGDELKVWTYSPLNVKLVREVLERDLEELRK